MIDAVHIAVCMKPVEGNFAQNALEHGVAGLNVDGCRVASVIDEMKGRSGVANRLNKIYGKGIRNPTDDIWEPSNNGRWPANVILDGSEEVVELLAGQSKAMGMHSAGNKKLSSCTVTPEQVYSGGWQTQVKNPDYYKDSGSAARFSRPVNLTRTKGD